MSRTPKQVISLYMFLPRYLFGLALLAAVTPAAAGTFTMNSPVTGPGGSVTVVTTFAGDGTTQDAQWDLGFDPALFHATEATVLIPESICVFSNELGLLRTVPPSGAGAAVTSTATAYCSFDLTVSANAAPVAHPLRLAFLECTPRISFGSPPCVGVPGAIVVVDGPEVVVDPAPGERLIIDRIDGAASTDLVTVRNIGIAALTLSVDVPAAPFSAALSSQTLAPGDTATLTVACNATAEGFASSTITLRTNDSNEPAISYAYRCFGGDTPDVHSVPAPGFRDMRLRGTEIGRYDRHHQRHRRAVASLDLRLLSGVGTGSGLQSSVRSPAATRRHSVAVPTSDSGAGQRVVAPAGLFDDGPRPARTGASSPRANSLASFRRKPESSDSRTSMTKTLDPGFRRDDVIEYWRIRISVFTQR